MKKENKIKEKKLEKIPRKAKVISTEIDRTKIQLISEIEKIINHRNLTQAKMAEILGINQPKVSRLMKYNLNDFSVTRLMHFLNVLGQNIDISMNSKSRNQEYGFTTINLIDPKNSLSKKNTITEKTHYIYTDNNLFRKLIKKNNESYWNSFYDAIIEIIPSLKNGFYRQIFTSFSFLEAIGEGRIRTKYAHKLNLTQFSVKKTDSLGVEIEKDCLRKILEDASLAAVNHFKNHPELSKDKLLKKIETQLKYSINLAADDLIKNTITRYKELITNDYESCLEKFAADLSWDSICAFDFLQLDKKLNGAEVGYREKFIKLKEMLLHVFHDAQIKGRDLNSFRLCESIQKERLTSIEFIKKIELENGNKKYKISIPGMLKDELDLCDVDVIHYATLGYMDPEFNQTFPVVVFTCDDRNVIKTRVLLQLTILRFMCNNVIDSKLKLVPGEIHFIDSKTGRVNAEPLIITDIKESETFEIKLEELPLDSESYVEFIKATPITAINLHNQQFENIFEPNSFDELQKLLDARKDLYLFRGQSPHNRDLNSTLARELRGLTSKLPRVYIPELPLARWPFKEMHRYHWIILRTFIPHEDLLKPLNGRGDPLFEIIRYIQMNPSQEKIKNAIPNHPTPTLEFSENSDIALYFSSYKESEDGGIYCLKKTSISTAYSFNDALDTMIKNEDPSPCILDPLAKINDQEDPKPKRQQSNYIFQRDLRHPISRYTSVEKIVIKKELYPAIKVYLESKRITEEFIYGKD